MGCEEQVHDVKCTRPFLPIEGLAPRLVRHKQVKVATVSVEMR